MSKTKRLQLFQFWLLRVGHCAALELIRIQSAIALRKRKINPMKKKGNLILFKLLKKMKILLKCYIV